MYFLNKNIFYEEFFDGGISPELIKLKDEVIENLKEQFRKVDEISELNTMKVLKAMRNLRISDAHFKTSTGYAYGDMGREKLDELFAEVFKSESALVRTQFVSGTHALATVLFGILRPDDELVSLTGAPYDTMQTVIGYERESTGSLKEFGITYRELDTPGGEIDFTGIKNFIKPQTVAQKTLKH